MGAPRFSHRDPTLSYMLSCLADAIDAVSGGGGSPILMSNVTRVDAINGNDFSGVPGNFGKPYQSIQAAVNASPSGFTILVGPGTYNEQVALSPVKDVQLVCAGYQETFVTGANPAISAAPTQDVGIVIKGLSCPNGGIQIAANGTNQLGINKLIAIDDVQTGPSGITLGRVNLALLRGCLPYIGLPSSITTNECSTILLFDCLGVSLNALWDNSNPLPANLSRNVSAQACQLQAVGQSGLAQIKIQNSEANNISSTPTNDVATVGKVSAENSSISSISIVPTIVGHPGPSAPIAEFKNCSLKDLFTDGSGSNVRIEVGVRQNGFDTGALITLGLKVDMDLRGSTYEQSSLVPTPGPVAQLGRANRSKHRIANQNIAAGPVGSTINVVPPFMDAGYVVLYEPAMPSEIVVGPGKSAGSFNAGGYVGGVPAPSGNVVGDLLLVHD